MKNPNVPRCVPKTLESSIFVCYLDAKVRTFFETAKYFGKKSLFYYALQVFAFVAVT